MIMWQDSQFKRGSCTGIRGQPLFLKRHIKRLKSSAKSLGFKMNKAPFRKIIRTLVKKNALQKAACRISLICHNGRPQLTIEVKPLTNRKALFKLWPVTDNRDDARIYRHKVTMRSCYLDMRAEAEQNHCDDALIIRDGAILETTVANIFFIKNGEIITPSLGHPILPGIMRDIIIKKTDAKETDISINRLNEFSSAFITNSLKGIKPVLSIGDIEYDIEPVLQLKQKLSL